MTSPTEPQCVTRVSYLKNIANLPNDVIVCNLLQGKNSRSEANLPETVSPHGTLRGNQPLKGITKIFANTKVSLYIYLFIYLFIYLVSE